MGFLEAYKSFWKNYTNFKGRAPGSAFWYVIVWNMIINGPLLVMSKIFGVSEILFGVGGGIALFFGGLRFLYWCGSIVPLISLIVRRLHDTGKSGYFAFLGLIPLVGPIIIFVFMSFESDGPNRYGDVYKKSDI
ncbi:DUF805 domain-containing protein [Listeria marthii]|uniref:DUF805 domain-containing protein n=1 Tax=Listeria marthii TaxID=529731 RepID=A0A842CGC8_9LIST|nr:DUF805 domain-containing protein [Listeria marthii]MBC1977377.1 DUF805 domain-containing protein [Listeria marthii]MBC1998771.1 DUF805 domain-containing protein [Listeria marthii]MBC2038463.1 DUF805 domain-containing protein [Listeria marthii]MBC2060793.1 DUF805 domain-containing protein [Listeria marthii]MBC2077229.1 DUF805 domain-containing protein [Listeria marthii]